jgi:uncharacterized protein
LEYQGVLFKTLSGNNYIFDNTTATTFKVPDQADSPAEFLNQINKSRISETLKYGRAIVHNKNALYKRMQKQFGAFTNLENPQPQSPGVDEIKRVIDQECFFQLILVVSNDCNLRCKYCFFSDAYPHSRNRSSSQMSFEVAKKAIDYYFTKLETIHRRYPGRKPCITFYGGEPLLNYELVRSVIEYANTQYGNNIIYSISTNGTLLSSERLQFLIESNVNIFISLDGPQEEHDRIRVTANNRGSFAEVYDNCLRVKEKYPLYQRVMLLCTYDWKTDLIKTNNFFEENGAKLPLISFVSSVAPSFTDYYQQFSSVEIKRFKEQLAFLGDQYLECKSAGKYAPNYLEILYGSQVASILLHGKMGNRRSAIIPYTGSCIPGNKICIQPEGQIDICERVNGRFPIGHVNTGLDYETIRNTLTLYNESLSGKCSSCPVSKLCNMCFQHFSGDKDFFRNPPDVCDSFRMNMIDRLAFTYSILEKNPNAFDDLSFGLIKCGL